MAVEFIRLDPTDHAPLHVQIERGIRAAVATGRLPPGTRLPTVRALAAALRVNPNTVARVYSELERNGLLQTRRGVGTFALEPAPSHLEPLSSHQALRELAVRVLEEVAARGFSRNEFIAQLQVPSK
jgi:DNA-binding transcriptional regulator YhcF (GntR family)